MTEGEARAAIVREARTWIGTPYHEGADIKGAGVDCGMMPMRVYSSLGLIEFRDPRPYPIQWSLHQKYERYLEIVRSYGYEVPGPPSPGDLVVFKLGHTYSHAGIVVDWPRRLIHANSHICEEEDNMEYNTLFIRLLQNGPPKFFSIWPRA